MTLRRQRRLSYRLPPQGGILCQSDPNAIRGSVALQRGIIRAMRLSAFSAGIAILALLLTATLVRAGDDALDLDEVRALLVGNTIHGIGEASGWFFAIYYRPDGVASGRSSVLKDVEPVYYDQGQWEITNEKGYCLKWNYWKGAKTRCMNMFARDGGYEFRTHDGARQSIVEVLEGNPDNL